jgi:hypothetical protein
MIALAWFDVVPLAIALAIGIVTGRWIFGGRRRPPAPPRQDPEQP